jgi:hypothetical protein
MRTPTKAERAKARKILADGKVRGRPLTDRARKFFYAVASGRPLKNPAYGEGGHDYDEDLEQYREALSGSSYYGIGEFTGGSGLDRPTRQVLQAIDEFGDQAWTREELGSNTERFKRVGGGLVSPATVAISIGKAIRPLLKRGAIVERQKRDGSQGYVLTSEGHNLAVADRYAAVEDATTSALERQIAELERTPEEKHSRTRTYIGPHAPAGKRHCKLCAVKHRLHEHRSHRVEGVREENPTTMLAVLPFVNPHEKSSTRGGRRSPSSSHGALERFLADKPKSFTARWGELPAWVKADPIARAAVLKWARINSVAVDLVPIGKTPEPGIWTAIGEEVANEYRPFEGARAGKTFRHAAGDNGHRKKTTPCVLAENAATGLQASVPLFGSRKRYGPRGITG